MSATFVRHAEYKERMSENIGERNIAAIILSDRQAIYHTCNFPTLETRDYVKLSKNKP